VDRPRALYEQPCTRFVAGFIGWPPMNFLDGEVVVEDGTTSFAGGGLVLPVAPAVGRAWRLLTGRRLTLGIRPEDVSLPDAPADGTPRMEVALVETLGASRLLTLGRFGWQVTAPTTATARAGQEVAVALAWERAHLFDAATGRALNPGRPHGSGG
jgi:multiple sugar transport system ATP-binding protein